MAACFPFPQPMCNFQPAPSAPVRRLQPIISGVFSEYMIAASGDVRLGCFHVFRGLGGVALQLALL
jgi:hypothetical protein